MDAQESTVRELLSEAKEIRRLLERLVNSTRDTERIKDGVNEIIRKLDRKW